MADRLFCRERGSRLRYDSGHYFFPPLLISDSHHAGLLYFLMLVQHRFNLLGRDILSSGDDDMLQAVRDIIISIFVLFPEIARSKPAIDKGRPRLPDLPPVARSDVRPS